MGWHVCDCCEGEVNVSHVKFDRQIVKSSVAYWEKVSWDCHLCGSCRRKVENAISGVIGKGYENVSSD